MLRIVGGSPFLLVIAALTASAPARCAKLELPPSAVAIIDHIYSGDLAPAIEGARGLQKIQPTHPLGYLLEGEALWLRIWCTSAEFKYGMTYPRHRAKLAADQRYFDLAAKATSLAEAEIAQRDSA